MFLVNGKISIRQFQVFFLTGLFGIVLVESVGNRQFFGRGGWMCLWGAAIFLIAAAAVFRGIFRLLPEGNLLPPSKQMNIFWKVLLFGLLIKILGDTVFRLYMAADSVRDLLMPHSSQKMIAVVILLLAFYSVRRGIEAIGRFGEVFFLCVLPLLLVVVILGFRSGDISELLPLRLPKEFLGRSFRLSLEASGMESIFLAIICLKDKKRNGGFSAVMALGTLLGIFGMSVTAVCGIGNLPIRKWAFLQMMDQIDLPGFFPEGQGVLLIAFWIGTIIIWIGRSLYFCREILFFLTGWKKGRLTAAGALSILLFLLFLFLQSIEQNNHLQETWQLIFGTLYLYIIPSITFIVLLLKKREGDKK